MAEGDLSLVLTGVDVEALVAGITPTLGEIAAINLARTDDGRGDTLATFTSETRPTNDVVEVVAVLAAQQVADRLGNNIPEDFQARARGAAAFYGAALVEGDARDPRDTLIRMWNEMADSRVKQLAAEIQAVGAGGEEGPGDDSPLPLYSFPCADPLPEAF